jgi:hypothetical protein
MITIPENLTEFLYWFKKRTEDFWSTSPEITHPEFIHPEDCMHGAKWIGMPEEDIDKMEKKYNITFSPEHREFLRVLHTLDKKCYYEDEDDLDENGSPKVKAYSFFYNWYTEEEKIKDMLQWPFRTILQDIMGPNKVWVKSWGTKPSSDEEKEAMFLEWYNKAPKLLPIYGHRFVVSGIDMPDRPILSVWGSDTIIYGWNLRHYLLNEVGEYLNLYEREYDKEDKCYYLYRIKAIEEIGMYEFDTARNRNIPYWEDVILYWSSGWSSFGKKSPTDTGEFIQPIVKVGDDDNTSKTFADFSN